jgi:hypothetical protein
MILRTSLLALGCALAAPALAAPPFAGRGTDVLHLTLRTEFVAANPESDDAGSLSAKLRQQGRADVQKLMLEVAGLAPDAAHHLVLWLRDGVEPAAVLSFDTDENGEASLKLMHVGHNDASGKKFPADLDPLSDVLAMEIRDEGDVVVLDADLKAPDWLQYLVKRRLTSSGVDTDAAGSLFMKENGTKVRFRLRAGNLDENAGYTLAIAAGLSETLVPVTTDAEGRLDLTELPDGAPAPFQMTGVELRAGSDVVLSTELP